MANLIKSVTVEAPINIAVIKYWGKKDEEKILALNDSLSVTLSTDEACATTTVAVSDLFTEDRFWLNDKEEIIAENKRLVNLLREIRQRGTEKLREKKIHICSKNNFPTAAGLASSAAGYACLVYALGQLFEINDLRTLSILARLGSGSACRSIYGGYVRWLSGDTSETSYAEQVAPLSHWPEMSCIILVVNDKAKETSSTSGMKNSTMTSELLQYRAKNIVPKRIELISNAILAKNFSEFAKITMQDSNQFHAICYDTWPPIRYTNDISWMVIKFVNEYNNFYGRLQLAYTFDAGPNACLYLLRENVDEVITLVNHFFPATMSDYSCLKGYFPSQQITINPELMCYLQNKLTIQNDSIKGIISTKVGDGPKVIASSLLNEKGFPLN